ncbi:uncharacterized protein LOC111297474 [Durio zibethinus]|uniref:Uncharacterized protein LOC111297474 n=1 Tax=Durio zibethinus TaxID=66656 RepID=A0A6P5Z5U0_DURZI|nr:uncharacterized protein LOC111297474 [Durio zibethinus]
MRLISDDILVAYELMHHLKNKKHMRKGFFALKLDISRAYDQVEWSFLEAIMDRMGFHYRWITSLKICVRSVSYSIVVNGRLTNEIFLVSPYLFRLCTKGLSALLKKCQDQGLLHAGQASRNGPQVNHLFFADDSLLFAMANRGQKEEIRTMFGVNETTNVEKYLGQQAMVGRDKRRAFRDLKDGIKTRMNGRCQRLLSLGGKEVFIKSILQSIPTYVMSCFLLPKTLCVKRSINCLTIIGGETIRSQEEYTGRIGRNWQRQKDGGMGFREMGEFNKDHIRQSRGLAYGQLRKFYSKA